VKTFSSRIYIATSYRVPVLVHFEKQDMTDFTRWITVIGVVIYDYISILVCCHFDTNRKCHRTVKWWL